MRNKIKKILLVTLSGIMIFNTPLSVLADTQYAKSGNNTTIESQSEKVDESYENTEGSLFSNQPLDEYLSKMNSNDRKDILESLDEKEAYQLIVLMQYDYINHFAQNQSLDLLYEVVKNYLDKKTIDTNSSSDDEKEAYNNCLGEWKEEILSYLDTDEKSIKEYEDSIVTSKQFDAKQLKEILQKIVTDINDKENLQSDEDAYIELKKLTFSKNEKDKSDNSIDNGKTTKNISYDIISFENYNGKDYYKTEYLNTDETDLITKMLPDTIKGSVQEASSKSNSSNIKSVNIPISWTCEEDIVKNKEKTYLFQAQLAKGYNLSQELKTQLENGDYQLPIYQIKVIEKSKYITGFVNYQGKSDEWYKEINVVSSEKDKISESLPQKIEVALQNGSNEQINVQWNCNNNIEDDQESSYIYSATLDGYKISDDLQQQIDSGNYKLPEIKVSIVDESSGNLIVRTEQTEVKNGKYEVYAYAPEADKVDLPVWTAETSEKKANNYSLKEGDYTVAGLKYNYKTTVNVSKPAKYESKLIATEYVENNDDNIAVAAMESRASGVCHIGSTYYATINEAVTAGGGTIYVTQSSITMDSTDDVTHNITLRPEGTNVTIKWKNGQTGKCAGLFRGADNKSGFTFDFGGNGNYTLTLDGNRGNNTNDVTYSGIISGHGVNVNLRKGLIIKSSSDQGVYIDHGTITMEDGVTIQYCNRGLSTNNGKIVMSGGKILNCGSGLNTQNLTMTGGTITSNAAKYCTGSYDSNNAGVGIQFDSDFSNIQSTTGTINISGGTISACDNYGIITGLAGISGTIKNCDITSNGYGVMLNSKDSITITGSVTISNNTIRGINVGSQATLTLASGNITKNTSSVSGAGIGVYGTLKMTGGSITNNASNTTSGGGGGGVYNNGTFTMSGGSISGNTTKGHGAGVFLDKNMNMSGAAVISTNNDVYENGSTYINVTSALTSSKAAIVTPSSYTLGRTLERASYSGANAETIFSKFSLTNKSPYFQRPGNKINSSANVKATDVVISRTYAINYKANTTDSVSNLPSAGSKYWFETATVSANIPQRTGYTFKSWNTKSDGTGTTYSASASIAASVNNDLTLYAQWTKDAPKTYTVRFNNNGGSGTMSDQTFNVGASQALKANTFTKSGYTFKGWNTQSNGSGTSYANQQTVKDLTSAGNTITLYAQWTENAPSTPKTYTVRFNNNGGSGTMSDQTFTVGVSQALKANTFTKSGYTFKGWNTQSNGSGTSYANQQTVKDLTSAGKTITLYAQWTQNTPSTPKTYTVRFNNNGGSGTMSDQTFTVGVSQALKANTFTKSGYTFKGWNTQSNGSGTSYANQQTVKDLTSAGKTITLYAQWTENAPSTPKTYTVRFNNNGGSGTMSDQTFTVGVSQALKANTFTKSGYTFKGWNTQSNGSGTSYANRQTVKDLTSAGNTITLYAQWTENAPSTPKTYTVRFNNNGGSGTMSDQTFTVGVSQALKANTFTKSGYTFKGWNTQSNGSGNSYTNRQTVKDLTSAGNTITLYAQWTKDAPKTYTVRFNNNGGSGTMSDQTFTVDVSQALKKNTFTRTGYTFKGWNSQSNGYGNSYTDQQTVRNLTSAGGTITLYAQWTANEYTNTLYYNANGGTGAPVSQTAKVTYPNTQKTFTVSSVKPTRAGYTFAGWYDAATGGNKIGATVTVGSNSHVGNQSKTIYAHWTANEYTNTLYYNANGGTGAPASQTAKVTYPNTQSTFYVSSVKPTRTGYTFAGWYDAATGGNKVGSTVTVGSNSHAGNQSKTIYAHWTANEYTNTLYYNANGGTGAPASQTAKVTYPNTQSTFYVSSVKPTRTGYTFAGWYDAATGGNKIGATVTVGSNNYAGNQSKTIYAHWTANHYKLTVNPNKGSLPDGTTTDKTLSPDLIYDNGNLNNINSQTPTRKGYTFTGWNTKADGSGVKVYDVNGACINGCGYWENNVYKGTTDLKVYAQWKANSYTITYNSNKPSNASNNVTGSTPNSTHTYDEPKNLTKNGYSLKGWTFTGWNTKADGSGKGYDDQQSVVNLAEKQGSIVVLYAQWRQNTYTIKYEGNGATSGSTPDSNMTYDKPGELNKNGFKKDNATFIGWKDENGNVYKDGETVKNLTPVDKGVVILKAQWDLAPTISAGEKTYYEGTTVTRDDLLKEVTATDPEDGTITNKIIITKIEYSAGKLVSGKKQPSYTQEWKDGMPKEATLDTWFMQLDKADSPVKHKVTYKVVDKVGNVTTKTVTVYVKYNNPPVITAVDRYFTLKEAQNGKVTADELLKNAIEKDKLKSTDIEEGVLSPKLELVGFNPADFTKLTTSAVVTVTYKVHDSYGPNGIGKETVNQIRVHITDPEQPEVAESKTIQRVRFITKKYYDLNKDKNIKDYLNNDSELAKINSNGGLRVGCDWYKINEYKSEITETFDKTSGTTYKFSHEDVKRIQDYINTNGIGNAKKADSLSTFYQKFLNK